MFSLARNLFAIDRAKPTVQLDNPDGMLLLMRRKEEMIHLVADILKNREIPERLIVKEHSIRNYLYRIFEKLGVSTRVLPSG